MRLGGKDRARRRLAFEPLEARLALDASMLRITEFLASNDGNIKDEDGEDSDWIEIYNSGADAVDLSGLHLTDDDDELDQWSFPLGETLDGKSYLIVFASSKDRAVAGGELHTNFKIGAEGEFLALVGTDGVSVIHQYDDPGAQLEDISYGLSMESVGSPTTILPTGAAAKVIVPTSGALGLSWTEANFNDAAWPISGPTGIGYENNPGDNPNYVNLIETQVPSGISTAYIRIKFDLASLSNIGGLKLRMQYDDGFVAYINGEQVAEANAPEDFQWDSSTGAARADSVAIIFEEFDVSSAIPHLRVGENVLAIHALNQPGGSDMLIVPELVVQPELVIAQPEFAGYFYIPTPGYGNGTGVAGFTAEPTYSVPHGFYATTQTVAISSATSGATIVYTTDGSTPQVDANLNITNGTLYVSPLAISSTTTLRASAFKATYEPSFVEASTYLFVDDVIGQSPLGQIPPGFPGNGAVNGQEISYGIDPDIINLYGAQAVKNSLLTLSTISITTDLENLFDPSTGIYVNAGNRGFSWERPSTVELINSDGSTGFEANAGLRIRGGYSRGPWNPKHAFRFYFRSEYGEGKLEFPLFGDQGAQEFDVLDLRSDMNYAWATHGDSQHSMVREVFGRDAQADMGDPYTRSRYHHLYINGVYWGVFQTQERVEEFYGESYLGGDKEDYDVVKSGLNTSGGTEVNSGNDVAWTQLFDYAEMLSGNPAANANVYWTMQGLNPDGTRNPSLPVLLDVDNVIDYALIIFYTGGFDSGISQFLGDNGGNNWFGIYNRVAADGGFKFFIHDNEHSMGVNNTGSIDRTGPFNNGNQSNYNQFNPQYLHQDLLAHPEYKQRFIDRVQTFFFNGGALTSAASIARLTERVNEVEPAVIAEAARWGDSKTSPPRNKTHWNSAINFLRNSYLPGRGNIVLNQLRNDGLYTTFAAPVFSKHGGQVANNFQLTVSSLANATLYYTTDGATDPRAIGGGVNPSLAVQTYAGPITISGATTVKARFRTSAGQWSGLVEASFTTIGKPGDYDGDGSVNGADLAVWTGAYGDAVPPGSGADGVADGFIDGADFLLWQRQVGAPSPAAPAAVTALGPVFSTLTTSETPPLADRPEFRPTLSIASPLTLTAADENHGRRSGGLAERTAYSRRLAENAAGADATFSADAWRPAIRSDWAAPKTVERASAAKDAAFDGFEIGCIEDELLVMAAGD